MAGRCRVRAEPRRSLRMSALASTEVGGDGGGKSGEQDIELARARSQRSAPECHPCRRQQPGRGERHHGLRAWSKDQGLQLVLCGEFFFFQSFFAC